MANLDSKDVVECGERFRVFRKALHVAIMEPYQSRPEDHQHEAARSP